MDGEVRDVHEQFSNGLQEPGDYSGDPSEYYNCRCTLVSVIDGMLSCISRIDVEDISYRVEGEEDADDEE